MTTENDDTFDPPYVKGADDAADTQNQLNDEMAAISKQYEDAGKEETQPRLDYAPYRSSILRHPTKDPRHADPETIELYAPAFGQRDVHALESDLTIQDGGEPIGERIRISGRILDGDGRPVRNQLVEIWQANAAGRYDHPADGRGDLPLDDAFHGFGRAGTDAEGRFSFVTLKPGPVPGPTAQTGSALSRGEASAASTETPMPRTSVRWGVNASATSRPAPTTATGPSSAIRSDSRSPATPWSAPWLLAIETTSTPAARSWSWPTRTDRPGIRSASPRGCGGSNGHLRTPSSPPTRPPTSSRPRWPPSTPPPRRGRPFATGQ